MQGEGGIIGKIKEDVALFYYNDNCIWFFFLDTR